jgi:hypothetical protein
MSISEIKIKLKPYNKYVIANFLSRKVEHKNTLIDYIFRNKIVLDFNILDNIKVTMRDSFITLINERKQQLLTKLADITKCKFIEYGYFYIDLRYTCDGLQKEPNKKSIDKNCHLLEIIDNVKLIIKIELEIDFCGKIHTLKYSFRNNNFYSPKYIVEDYNIYLKYQIVVEL